MAPPFKQITVTVAGFVLIIIAMTIVYTLSKQSKESFANSTTLPLAEYNALMVGSNCMRDMEFINYATAKHNVSERSVVSPYARSTCTVSLREQQLPEEYSVIEENSIKYAIQMMCMQPRFTNVYLTTRPEHIVFTFKNESQDDVSNLIAIYLSNPIYFEFENSSPYVPVYMANSSYYKSFNTGRIFNQEKSGNTIQCAFRRLVDGPVTANEAFKYPKAQEPMQTLRQALLDKTDNVKVLDMKIYYLDPKDAQTSGIVMSLANQYKSSPKIGTMKVYRKNYIASLDKSSDAFFFNQKIFIMLQNASMPIFTFTFDINIPDNAYESILNKQTEILKVAMDVPLERDQSSCGFNFAPLDGKGNGNILSCTVYSVNLRQETFVLSFLTPNMSASGACFFPESSALRVELPFANDIQRTRVVITVSPYNKICFCKWKKNGVDAFVYKRTQVCDPNNSFRQLLQRKSVGGTLVNEDINLIYHTNYVADVQRVQLGHVHYLDDFYK